MPTHWRSVAASVRITRTEPPDPDLTRELLVRWHGGDQDALGELIQRDGAWIERVVRERLGPSLRRRFDTQDVVQNTVMEVLRNAPRFVVGDRAHFRALVAKMAENSLRGQVRGARAEKRDVRREALPRSGDSLLFLDAQPGAQTAPDAAADRSEMRDWVRLALELLDADDREVIVLRDYQSLGFPEIGERLGLGENGARMRYNRALPKLAKKLAALRKGAIGGLLGERAVDPAD